MLLVRWLCCAALLAVAGAIDAREIWERPWLEVRSEHFVIASALSEERTLALAVELENFRSPRRHADRGGRRRGSDRHEDLLAAARGTRPRLRRCERLQARAGFRRRWRSQVGTER